MSTSSATIRALAHSRPISSDHRHATASGAGSHTGAGVAVEGRDDQKHQWVIHTAYP